MSAWDAPRIIDQRDNGMIYLDVAEGDVLGAANVQDWARMEGEVGDTVLWTTRSGAARGEVVGTKILEGGIPATLVKVTAAPYVSKS